jgi:hypothetical protein
MMIILKRFPLFVVLFVVLALAGMVLQANIAQAQPAIPFGSCGDTVSDDAQLFGNRIGDVVNQAQTTNNSLQADTRVVTVNQNTLAGRSLRDYFRYIVSKCPQWGEPQFVVLILAKGYEPFLHLGTTFSGKMTAADFQQMTLSIRSELTNGNNSQATIDLLTQVQKKLSPDYTWIWVTLAVLIVLGTVVVLAIVFIRRRLALAAAKVAQEQAIHARQAAVNVSSVLSKQIEALSPRIEVLLALTPQITATQLSALFETAKEKASNPQERLGNLLGNPDTNPSGKTFRLEHYAQMQRAYQEVYSLAQEPMYLLHAIETAVQRLEKNPQEEIDFQQLTMHGLSQGNRRISQPGSSLESPWSVQ